MNLDERLAVGRRLQAVRKICGYTQEEVASAVGIRREELSYVETGARGLSAPLLERLADLYGYSPAYFLAEGEPVDSGAIAFRARALPTEERRRFEAWARRLVNNFVDLSELVQEMEDASR